MLQPLNESTAFDLVPSRNTTTSKLLKHLSRGGVHGEISTHRCIASLEAKQFLCSYSKNNSHNKLVTCITGYQFRHWHGTLSEHEIGGEYGFEGRVLGSHSKWMCRPLSGQAEQSLEAILAFHCTARRLKKVRAMNNGYREQTLFEIIELSRHPTFDKIQNSK